MANAIRRTLRQRQHLPHPRMADSYAFAFGISQRSPVSSNTKIARVDVAHKDAGVWAVVVDRQRTRMTNRSALRDSLGEVQVRLARFG